MFPKAIAPNLSQGTIVHFGTPTALEDSTGKLYLEDGFTIASVVLPTNLELEYWNGGVWVNFYNASVTDGTFINYTTAITFASGIKIRGRLTSALGSTDYATEVTAPYTATGGRTAFSAAVSAAQTSSGFEITNASMDSATASATVGNIPTLLRTANTYLNLIIYTEWNSQGGAPTFPTGRAVDQDSFSQAGATFASGGSVTLSGAGIPDLTAQCYAVFYIQYPDEGTSAEVGSRTPTLNFTPDP